MLLTGLTVAYADDNAPVYRLYNKNTGEHFYTQSLDEANSLTAVWWNYEGVNWGTPTSRTVIPVYRAYNPNSGEHLFTANISEYMGLGDQGWNQEGEAWFALLNGGKPVYRLFNPYNTGANTHLYTTDESEYNSLQQVGWIAEGEAWRSPEAPSNFTVPNPSPPKPTAEDLFVQEWAPRIDRYNAGWPLGGHGETFARAAYAYGMDPRTAPAIARIESGSGKVPLYRYGAGNCWGWMAYLGNDFDTAIWNYCKAFSRGYGSTLTPSSAVTYSGGNYSYYYILQNEMSKI